MRRLIFVVLCFATSLALAKEAPVTHISGIYSSLTYHKEAGDLTGMELLIFPSAESSKSTYTALVQIAEGGTPFAVIVPLRLNGSEIEFDMPAGGPYSGEHFVGTFVGKDIVFRGRYGTKERLKRGKSYWQ